MRTIAPYQNVDDLKDGLQWRKHIFFLKNKLYLGLKRRNIACDAKQ